MYKVDQSKIVEPDDSRDLRIEKGEDYVTLVTCTPYGINSHRLLARGTRKYLTEAEAEAYFIENGYFLKNTCNF